MKRQKRIVSIQDVSCFGKCSLTVALPIISAMGVECAIVPTAVLSTHTGGFTGYTFCDLTDEIEKIQKHWLDCGLSFDAIYTGYLGSARQLQLVSEFIDAFSPSSPLVFIDPVMGDNGKLYAGFDAAFAAGMAKLCGKADVIVPNMTEASMMLGEPYIASGYDRAYVENMLKRLCALGCRRAVLTGIVYEPERQGAVAYDSETNEYCEYFRENLPVSYHGTGDVFSSSLAGALVRGEPMNEALRTAVDYTVECIKATMPDDSHRYGVRFEDKLSMLANGR